MVSWRTARMPAHARGGVGCIPECSKRLRFGTKAISLCVVLSALTAQGFAWSSPSARLVYLRAQGAERCPDAPALRNAVAARLGFDPFFATADKTIVAEIREGAHGFRGRVVVSDGDGRVLGERVVESPSDDCTEMVSAMALGISIAVDNLDFELRVTPAPPTTTPLPSPPVIPDRRPEPRTEPPSVPSVFGPRVRYEASVGLEGSLGTAPSPAVGAAAGLGLRWRALGLGVEARFEPSTSATLATGGSVWSSLVMGTVTACVHARLPFACALGSVGSFQGGGEDIHAPRSDSVLFAAVGVRAGVQVPISSPFYLQGHVDVTASLTPTHIAIDGHDAYTLPLLAAVLGARAGVAF